VSSMNEEGVVELELEDDKWGFVWWFVIPLLVLLSIRIIVALVWGV